MTLTLNSAAAVLSEHNLLREIINGDSWQLDTAHIDGVDTPFTNLTYDTRTVAPTPCWYARDGSGRNSSTAPKSAAWPPMLRKATFPPTPPNPV